MLSQSYTEVSSYPIDLLVFNCFLSLGPCGELKLVGWLVTRIPYVPSVDPLADDIEGFRDFGFRYFSVDGPSYVVDNVFLLKISYVSTKFC